MPDRSVPARSRTFPSRSSGGDGLVRMTRWILDSPPPPMYRDFGGFTGNIDRCQIAESRLPSTNVVHAGCAVAGTGGPEGDFRQGIEFFNLNAMTPETETTTHYFYAHARSFALDDEAVDEIYRRDFRAVFQEDVDILAAQQESLDRDPVPPAGRYQRRRARSGPPADAARGHRAGSRRGPNTRVPPEAEARGADHRSFGEGRYTRSRCRIPRATIRPSRTFAPEDRWENNARRFR